MKSKMTDEYKVFKRKIMLRFLITAFIATGVVLLFYFLVWYERVGDWIVSVLQYFGMTKHEAFEFYHVSLRQNKSVFFAIAIILIFMILLRYLFVWIVRYFNHINDGIDKLLIDDNQPLHLLPEMEPMEKKLNTVKQTLWQRKQDSLLAEQRKNEIVMYLAHDIRTPLTSVIGYLNLLEEDPEMPIEQRAKYVHITLDKACRLEKMINEFFEITRYNSGQITLSKSTIDLYFMLVQLTDELSPSFAVRGNSVVLNMEEDLTIYADADKIARVFSNILRNAAAYSYPQTPIIISAKKTDKHITVFFQNKGKTIPEKDKRHLFDKFYRSDKARGSDKGGTGLGLAIAREIVLLHGGQINVISKNDTVIFAVRLPATD